MKPKVHAAVIQKRESREEKLSHMTSHNHQAQSGPRRSSLTVYKSCQPGTLRANHSFYK